MRDLNTAQSFVKPVITNGSVVLAIIGAVVGVVRNVPAAVLDSLWPLLILGLGVYMLVSFQKGDKAGKQ